MTGAKEKKLFLITASFRQRDKSTENVAMVIATNTKRQAVARFCKEHELVQRDRPPNPGFLKLSVKVIPLNRFHFVANGEMKGVALQMYGKKGVYIA